jgi:hypothetical protein
MKKKDKELNWLIRKHKESGDVITSHFFVIGDDEHYVVQVIRVDSKEVINTMKKLDRHIQE